MNEVSVREENGYNEPFNVRDCALITLSTGHTAQTLREFRDRLEVVPDASIYHHFWGRFLQPQFDEPEYNNDFAAWIYNDLHEKALAERLSVIDPTEFDDISALRGELIERVEEYLDEVPWVPWSRADQLFFFVRSQIVIMDTGKVLDHPSELAPALNEMSLGSIFYHFIDARRRTDAREDDFSAWLAGWGERYRPLIEAIHAIDPYFSSLKEIRRLLRDLFTGFFSESGSKVT